MKLLKYNLNKDGHDRHYQFNWHSRNGTQLYNIYMYMKNNVNVYKEVI